MQANVAETKTQSWKRGKETYHFIPEQSGPATQYHGMPADRRVNRPRPTYVKPNQQAYINNFNNFGRKNPNYVLRPPINRPRPTYVKPNQQVYINKFRGNDRKNPYPVKPNQKAYVNQFRNVGQKKPPTTRPRQTYAVKPNQKSYVNQFRG